MQIFHPFDPTLSVAISDCPTKPEYIAPESVNAFKDGDSLDKVIAIADALQKQGFTHINIVSDVSLTKNIMVTKLGETKDEFQKRLCYYDKCYDLWVEERLAAEASLEALFKVRNYNSQKYSNPKFIEFLKLQSEMRDLGFI